MLSGIRPSAIVGTMALVISLAACAPSSERSEEPPTTAKTEPTAEDMATNLAGTEWVLTSLRGRTLNGTNITLEIVEDQPYTRFGGDAVCNSYGGRNVATDDGAVEINTIESTAAGCPGDIERTYYDALMTSATYRVRDDRLEIQNAAGETILVYAMKGKSRRLPDSGGWTDGVEQRSYRSSQ